MLKKLRKFGQSLKLPKKLSSTRKELVLGGSLVAIGLIFILVNLLGTWISQHTSAAPDPNALISGDVNAEPTVSGEPVRIIIPSLNIDLKVIPGYYNVATNSWNLTIDSAQFAEISAKPNDKRGMTFIYGHYRRSVFLSLPKIKPGAEVIIKTQNNHSFTYTYRAYTVIPPTDTSVFNYKGKPILVLQTCTGVHFQNRQLFVLDLKSIDQKNVTP